MCTGCGKILLTKARECKKCPDCGKGNYFTDKSRERNLFSSDNRREAVNFIRENSKKAEWIEYKRVKR